MTTYQFNSTHSLRPDDDILADIWEGLWQADTIRSTDMHSASVSVRDGEVTLGGHMASAFNRRRVETIARLVPGVVTVRNDIVADSDLRIWVAQALGRDERTRPYVLPVGSDHGWIQIGGIVASREIQRVAETVAARVPAVRGVIGLPRVAGESPMPARRAVEPRPGARVYTDDGQAGMVVQVIINRQNRLVTHMVVSLKHAVETNDVIGFREVSGEFLVPIEAAEIVNDESVFLQRQPSSITAYPPFEAEAYPFAPANWQPPYPYSLNTVRWSQAEFQAAPAIRAVPGTSQIGVQGRRERAEDRARAGVRPTLGLPTRWSPETTNAHSGGSIVH